MSSLIHIEENDVNLVVEVTSEKDVRLLHCSALPFDAASWEGEKPAKWYRMLELQVTGENQNDHHGEKNTGTAPANRLTYREHKDYRNDHGRKIEFILEDSDQLTAICHYQFYGEAAVLRCWTEVTNHTTESVGLEMLSSFCMNGLTRHSQANWENTARLHIPHNSWYAEAQWTADTLGDLGFQHINGACMHRIYKGATGSWSSSDCLPMGAFENESTGEIWAWQIETCGSWHWEIGELADSLYMVLSGPTEKENLWWKSLKTGETFSSVPVAVAVTTGSTEKAWREMTRYRRAMRRKHDDTEKLPIIFNDYMNCLFGDPTTEKLIPLIDAAAEAGCEIFCIDSGWYDSGFWWDKVGQWLPSEERFPDGGIQRPIDYIKSKGMVPGLWLEIEVMGIECPLATQVPEDWFFMRHGKRIIDHGRYQLDFRNPAVIDHANEVIDRLVGQWGIGYIKNDYNIQIGPGTDLNADSFGDGLESHNRAFVQWLNDIHDRYPNLTIENCSSGSMRTGYGLLGTCAIQSSSDQTDYRKYASIAVNSMSVVAPEQCGIWSYPVREGDREEVIFNMVNAMIGRIHQSGHLPELTPERMALVQEGLNVYKTMRAHIKTALPTWPIGMRRMRDGWHAFGLENENQLHLAVWRTHDASPVLDIPLNAYRNQELTVECAYPQQADCQWQWHAPSGILTVNFPKNDMARLFKITLK